MWLWWFQWHHWQPHATLAYWDIAVFSRRHPFSCHAVSQFCRNNKPQWSQQFIAGDVDTSDKIVSGCIVWKKINVKRVAYRHQKNKFKKNIREFSKKLETLLMGHSGARARHFLSLSKYQFNVGRQWWRGYLYLPNIIFMIGIFLICLYSCEPFSNMLVFKIMVYLVNRWQTWYCRPLVHPVGWVI